MHLRVVEGNGFYAMAFSDELSDHGRIKGGFVAIEADTEPIGGFRDQQSASIGLGMNVRAHPKDNLTLRQRCQCPRPEAGEGIEWSVMLFLEREGAAR